MLGTQTVSATKAKVERGCVEMLPCETAIYTPQTTRLSSQTQTLDPEPKI